MRQLNIAKKKGESSENKHMTDGTSIGSMGSRTSSNASLDTAGSGNHLPVNSSAPGGIHHVSNQSTHKLLLTSIAI